MAEMKAMEFTDELNLQPVRRPVPEPQAGEILIQVYAAGVTPTEKLWYPTNHRLRARRKVVIAPDRKSLVQGGRRGSGTVIRELSINSICRF